MKSPVLRRQSLWVQLGLGMCHASTGRRYGRGSTHPQYHQPSHQRKFARLSSDDCTNGAGGRKSALRGGLQGDPPCRSDQSCRRRRVGVRRRLPTESFPSSVDFRRQIPRRPDLADSGSSNRDPAIPEGASRRLLDASTSRQGKEVDLVESAWVSSPIPFPHPCGLPIGLKKNLGFSNRIERG